MLEDLRTFDDGRTLQVDLCIVGAGAAGISIAHALVGSGLTVCLLESGGQSPDAAVQALYEGDNVGHPIIPTEGRYRVFGGSTIRWTGRCAKLDPLDFEARDWIPFSGWPITAADLAPWYEQALPVCGFPKGWTDAHGAEKAIGAKMPAFAPASGLEPFVWRYAAQRSGASINWGVRYGPALKAAPNVQVLMHANVTDFEAESNGGRVSAVLARTLSGVSVRVRARAFVLACGGIENARLLLASARAVPGGLGSGRDQVGRYLMQHPRGDIAAVRATPTEGAALQYTFNNFRVSHGLQHEVGFALSASTQRRERLLNASAVLTYQPDPDSAWESAKQFGHSLRRRKIDTDVIGRMANDPVEIGRNLWRRAALDRVAIVKSSTIKVLIDLEQAPDPDSRVQLSDRVDALGSPLPRLDWRVGAIERKTARAFAHLAAAEFSRLGLPQVEPEAWLESAGPIGADELSGTYHHIATTRMSASAMDGVVDRNCRVHGVDNLYVSGCSVFATGGHANPTFTIVALALRTAAFLREQLTLA